jgi:hypothetical protein
MVIEPNTPDPEGERENLLGEEPDEESGGGYGNHAAPDITKEPAAPGKDAR